MTEILRWNAQVSVSGKGYKNTTGEDLASHDEPWAIAVKSGSTF
jgi:hypothetical protein